MLGLEAYWTKFEENSYAEPNFLADLKLMDKPLLSKTFAIKKPAHLRKLVKAVKKLKYPTAGERLFYTFIHSFIYLFIHSFIHYLQQDVSYSF